MDRIELNEELELEQYERKQVKALNFDISRLKVKKVSNHDHARNVALADEIKQVWGLPIPRVLKFIERWGYKWVWECYNECKKSNARSPVALFQWKLKQVKPDLKEI